MGIVISVVSPDIKNCARVNRVKGILIVATVTTKTSCNEDLYCLEVIPVYDEK